MRARYQIEQLIGQGGMGRVYRAHDRDKNRIVALKSLHDPNTALSFQEEFKILSRLDHPHLIRIYDFHGEASEVADSRELAGPCFTMEYGEGKSLNAHLGDKEISAEEWIALFGQITEGIRYLHGRNILHRDLKPSNVILLPGNRAKILDFGLATLQGQAGAGRGTGGTWSYLSPEALWGEYEARSDLFSLGVLSYECLTGVLPYGDVLSALKKKSPGPPSLAGLRPDLPEFFRDLIHRLLELNPSRRPASPLSVLRYLQQHALAQPAKESPREILGKPAFLGRDRELQTLRRRLHDSQKRGQAAWAEIAGPTGIGRSRLLEEIKWQLQIDSWLWIEIGPSSLPAWPAEILRGLGAGVAGANLIEQSELIAQSCAGRRVALALTDLHEWPDGALQDLALFLKLIQNRPGPGLVICEINTDFSREALGKLSEFLRAHDTLALPLNGLDVEASLALLRSAWVGEEIEDARLKEIARQTGGRPLLLLEVLRNYDPKGLGSLSVSASFSERLLAASRAKIAALSPGAREVLALLVSHPGSLAWGDLPTLLSDPVQAWDLSVAELDAAGILKARTQDPSLSLAQSSLRGPYREALDEKLLRRSHERWLQFWLGRYGEEPEPHEGAALIAEHAFQAGDKERAYAWGMQAGAALEAQGRLEAALAAYDRILPWAGTPETRYPVHAYRAPLLRRLGRFDESLQAYELWYRDRIDDATLLQKAKYYFFLGHTLMAAGRESEARAQFEACLAVGPVGAFATHHPFHARSLAFLASLEKDFGSLPATRKKLLQALDLATDNPMLLGDIEQRLGELEKDQLQYDAAFRHFQKSREHFRRAASVQGEAVALQYLAMTLREFKRLNEASALLGQAVAKSTESGQILQWARYLGNWGLIQMDLGDYGEALRCLGKAGEVLEVAGNESDRRVGEMLRLELDLRMGNYHRAEELFRNLESKAADLKAQGSWWEVRCIRALHHYQTGHYGIAQEEIEAVLTGEAGAQLRPYDRLKWELFRIACLVRGAGLPARDPGGERARVALKTLQGPYFPLWRDVLALCSQAPDVVPTTQALVDLVQRMEALPAPELRMDLKTLLAVELSRRGLAQSPRALFARARRDYDLVFNRLPEEFKMDFEKNRPPAAIDADLSSLIGDAPPAPAMQTMPAPPPPAQTGPSAAPQVPELRFRQFSEISRQIAAKNDLPDILERVMDAAIELTGAERGFLLLKNEGAADGPLPGFAVKTARNLNQKSLTRDEMKISLSAVRQAMEQGSTLLTENAQLDPRLKGKESVVQLQLKAILVVPLERDGETMGAVYLDHRYHPGCFAEEDLVFLNAFSAQASVAIQKAQLIGDLQAANRKLEDKVETQAKAIESLNDELAHIREQLRYGYEEIVGQSAPMMEVFRLLDHVSDTAIPVWIRGESGTGKELVARSLHVNSSRKGKPYVSENCSAIPENLLESELFGHKKGAFTHADKDRIGLFQQANGGTLFLDEVADMSPGMQVKLLRALQEGEVRPLGSNQTVKVDVRLVTASNKDLAKMVESGKFRQDLFFRINGMTIPLPPLRERKEDIPLLVTHLAEKISRDFKLKPSEVTDEAYEAMMKHSWPGNIRELEAVLRNALLFAKGRPLTPALLAFGMAATEGAPAPEAGASREERSEERRLIVESLRKHRMNKRNAAKEIGISIRSFYMRMDRHKIPKNKAVLKKFLGLKE